MRKLRNLFVLLIGIIALTAAMQAGRIDAQDATPTAVIVLTPVPAAQAEEAVSVDDQLQTRLEVVTESANYALNAVNSMMGFIQVASILLALLFGVVQYIGFRSINEYGKELAALKTQMNQELKSLRADVESEISRAQEQFNDLRSSSRSEFDALLGLYNERIKDFESSASAKMTLISQFETDFGEQLAKAQRREEQSIKALTLVQLGKLQIDNRNWTSALRTFSAAQALDPNNRAANYYLGELYIIRRELDQAVTMLKRAQPDGEIFPPAEAALAFALRLQGDATNIPFDRDRAYAEAEQRYLDALKIEPDVRDIHDASVWAGLGALRRRQGRLDAAIEAYERAEQVTPYHSYPLINLGMLYLNKGDREKARAAFQTVVEITERRLETNPNDEWTRFDAVTANLGIGSLERARVHLKRIFADKPNPGPVESFLSGLHFMSKAPNAPDYLNDIVVEVQQHLTGNAL